MNPNRLKILNIWVDSLNRAQAIQMVRDFVEHGNRPHVIFASNPEKNFSVPRDPDLYAVFSRADLLLPDGIGMVLAAKLLYGVEISRIPGVEFMGEICRLSASNGYRVFVYGAREDVNSRAVTVLREKYPGINIVGRANGYVRDSDMPELVKKINESRAQVLFLALGSPKQEQWFARYRDELHGVRVCQGIGGSLDAITGRVRRAPAFWRRIGLEWFYRLITEPKRIKRQKVLPLFAMRVLMSVPGRRFRQRSVTG